MHQSNRFRLFMVSLAVAGAIAVALLLHTVQDHQIASAIAQSWSTEKTGTALISSQQPPMPGQKELAKQPVSETEIKKLIANLGGKDFKVREEVSKRLAEIGVPALDALQDAEENPDLEIQQRAANLVKDIRAANRLPTIVKGMEFKLIVNKTKWSIPRLENEAACEFKIALQITNKRETIYRLFLYHNVDVVLIKVVPGPSLLERSIAQNGGNLARPAPLVSNEASAPLKKSESVTISLECRVVLPLFGDACLICRQALGEFWSTHWFADRLDKGDYHLALAYSNSELATDGLEPCWLGQAESLYEPISIHER